MRAIVHVQLDRDTDTVRFDVDLISLPKIYLDGYEFVATFQALNFDNAKTFYTDSNGLNMEKRILNHRSFYNFTEKWDHPSIPGYNQNISSNYYPVNSAISIKDEG